MKVSRLLATWAILAVAMVANGAARELWLKDFLSVPTADTLSVVTGMVLILIVTRLMFRIAAETPRPELIRMALTLVGLTIAFEVTVGVVEGKSWSTILGDYALWRGRLWPLVLFTIAATPFLWRRWGGRGDRLVNAFR